MQISSGSLEQVTWALIPDDHDDHISTFPWLLPSVGWDKNQQATEIWGTCPSDSPGWPLSDSDEFCLQRPQLAADGSSLHFHGDTKESLCLPCPNWLLLLVSLNPAYMIANSSSFLLLFLLWVFFFPAETQNNTGEKQIILFTNLFLNKNEVRGYVHRYCVGN